MAKTKSTVKNPVLEISKQGVAVFAPGQHPKDLQLKAKRALEGAEEPVAPVVPAVEEQEEEVEEKPAEETPAEEAAEVEEEPKKGKK